MYFSAMDYVDIARRSFARRRQQWCGGKTTYFVGECVNISKTVGDTSKVTIYDMRFRQTPRSMTMDDLELYKFDFSENFS